MLTAERATGVVAVLLLNTSTSYLVTSVGVTRNVYRAGAPAGWRVSDATGAGAAANGNCWAYSPATSPLAACAASPLICALRSLALSNST